MPGCDREKTDFEGEGQKKGVLTKKMIDHGKTISFSEGITKIKKKYMPKNSKGKAQGGLKKVPNQS